MPGHYYNNKTRSAALTASAANPDDIYFATDAPVIVTGGKEYGDMSLDVTALFTHGGTLQGIQPGEFGKRHMYVDTGVGEYVTAGNMSCAATRTAYLYIDMYVGSFQRVIAKCTYDDSTDTWTCQNLTTKNL